MSLSFSPATFPTEPSNDGVVAIFWDYESYPSPHTPSIAEAVKAIQMVALDSGSVNSFNLYVDLDRHSKDAGKAASIRQQLHEAGVSVVDCPSNASKTVADKMIIVDLFAFALKSRLPGTVVVISADQDLAYTLSLLRQRRFNVTLISSDTALLEATTTFGSQADSPLTWSRSTTGRILSPISNNHVSHIVDPGPSSRLMLHSPLQEPAVLSSTVQPPPSASRDLSQVAATSQISPLPSSSLNPTTSHNISNPASSEANNAGSSQNFTRASVPEHLHDVVMILRAVTRRQGWQEVAIYERLRYLNKTKWNNQQALVSSHIGEAVRLGIFVRSTALSKKDGRERTYYAMEQTLKENWG